MINNVLHYLKYFFYIGLNWNFRLAFFTIFHEIRGEKKYKIQTSRLNDLTKLSVIGNNKEHAEIYQGVNYFLLESVFRFLQNTVADKNIVDYGCGKGRALAVAAYYGFDTITGVEFAEELCNEARKNIAPLQLKFPHKVIEIIHTDATEYEINETQNIFFFFNPFDEIILNQVITNILTSLSKFKRNVYVAYINPRHKELFIKAGFIEMYYIKKMEYAEASVMAILVS